MAPLTHQQLLAIEVCTRTMSVLSLLGSCFIISTFTLFPPFRRPINRLVFYATFGNILANVATLISTSGIPSDPDELSPLCEFQGVLIQWFMMADSFWVFSMAINVFLVFWFGYNAQRLRYLEKWYLLFAYGLPAIPPIIYIILDHHSRTRVMGSATVRLMCHIKLAHTNLSALVLGRERYRLDAYRLLLWACLVSTSGTITPILLTWHRVVVTATLTIYIMTGMRILKQRALLRYFTRQPKNTTGQRCSTLVEETMPKFPAPEKSIRVTTTTHIHHDVHQQERDSQRVSMEIDDESLSSYSSTRNLSNVREDLSGSTRVPRLSRDFKRSESPYQELEDAETGYRATAFASSPSAEPATLPSRPFSAIVTHQGHRARSAVGNAAALAYLKVAFLMFIALFVVWVPSVSFPLSNSNFILTMHRRSTDCISLFTRTSQATCSTSSPLSSSHYKVPGMPLSTYTQHDRSVGEHTG
jgi:hypothetical protein